MRRIGPQALLWGLVFGLTVVVVDGLMNAFAPATPTGGTQEPTGAQVATGCLNFIISCILYYLSGYITGSLTALRRQGQLAGLLAGIIAGIGGALVALLYIPRLRNSPGDLLLQMLLLVIWNAPIGFVFGSIGGRIGSRKE